MDGMILFVAPHRTWMGDRPQEEIFSAWHNFMFIMDRVNILIRESCKLTLQLSVLRSVGCSGSPASWTHPHGAVATITVWSRQPGWAITVTDRVKKKTGWMVRYIFSERFNVDYPHIIYGPTSQNHPTTVASPTPSCNHQPPTAPLALHYGTTSVRGSGYVCSCLGCVGRMTMWVSYIFN